MALLLLISLLPSCTNEKKAPSCLSVLEAMVDAEVGLPAGRIYSLSSENTDGYLSESLIKALYGNGSLPAVSESWIDCAVFISTLGHPCELAIVYCADRNAAEDTARLFGSRLNSVRALKVDEEYGNMLDFAQISICGNFVLMIISSDPDNALKIAKKLI
ncbi:MAG: hypothetical protein E7592_01480 [Ruminococcaceae bacterium]|nr:hypothetical protein [Oscillospiraceae bacterium]